MIGIIIHCIVVRWVRHIQRDWLVKTLIFSQKGILEVWISQPVCLREKEAGNTHDQANHNTSWDYFYPHLIPTRAITLLLNCESYVHISLKKAFNRQNLKVVEGSSISLFRLGRIGRHMLIIRKVITSLGFRSLNVNLNHYCSNLWMVSIFTCGSMLTWLKYDLVHQPHTNNQVSFVMEIVH